MSTATVSELHPFDAAVKAGREPYKSRISASPSSGAGIRLAEPEIPA